MVELGRVEPVLDSTRRLYLRLPFIPGPERCLGGTLGKGIFKTADGGREWMEVSTGLTDRNIESLAVDATRPEVLYTGTVSRGVFKSSEHHVEAEYLGHDR